MARGQPASNERKSYKRRTVAWTRGRQRTRAGVLQDTVVITVDPVTGATTTSNITVSPSLGAGNARGSRFFSRFAPGGTHAGYLTPAELRLVSEWVDIGAQYFNNPFDPAVPLD